MARKDQWWLKTQIEKIEATNSRHKEKITEILNILPDTYNPFKEWTPLKLILLNYSLQVCTTIISKHKHIFKEMYYVDLFAGSGINKIKNGRNFLIGSPLISALNHYDKYTKMFYAEKNPEYAKALQLRLKTLGKKNLEVFEGKYEDYLPNILTRINKPDAYTFFFIDPHSTEFSWEHMQEILSTRSDILFTFMTTEINRAAGFARSGLGGEEKLKNLFGDNSWSSAKSPEELVQIYKKNILKIRTNAVIKTIKVQSQQFNFYYHLFFITNKTKGQNPWIKAIDTVKKEIEKNSDAAVKMALRIINKEQTQLFQF